MNQAAHTKLALHEVGDVHCHQCGEPVSPNRVTARHKARLSNAVGSMISASGVETRIHMAAAFDLPPSMLVNAADLEWLSEIVYLCPACEIKFRVEMNK